MTKESLKELPPEGSVQPLNGALHIPIEQLEDMLDEYDYNTKNYHSDLYQDGNEICCKASIEVTIILDQEKDPDKPYLFTKRTFVGACNFKLSLLQENIDWNATAKSLCIKNAATDIGKKFGRGMNSHLSKLPDETQAPKRKYKLLYPDAAIIDQYKKYKRSDHPMAKNLEEMYDLKDYADVTEE